MTKYSDGKARDVTAGADVVKGTPARVSGWNGIYENDALTGELVAFNVDPTEFHYFATPSGVGAAVGDLIYITPGGVLSNTSNTGANAVFAKTDVARDSNGVVGARILNIS